MVFNNVRLYITEACNAKCSNCFNRDNRKNQYMDINRYIKICKFISKCGGNQVKIMGGEPTIHPQFGDFMQIAQEHFTTVSLFTNAISDTLYDFIPRETDIVTYNFKFSKLLDTNRLLLKHLGIRNLEIQITPSVNKEKLVEEISRVTSLEPDRIIPCFTLDCTANIFEDRELLIEIYEYVWEQCVNKGFHVGQDHLIPLCFLAGTKIPMVKTGTNCTLNCAGLIDSEFNLRFCNQFSDTLIYMFDDRGNVINRDIIYKVINDEHERLLEIVKSKGCEKCSLFSLYCNGGCFVGKPTIPSIKARF